MLTTFSIKYTHLKRIFKQVDNLKELTVWCEDEIPEDRTDLLVVFMSAIAQCQHKLKKLCLGLPLRNQKVLAHVKNIITSCPKLDTFIFGVQDVKDAIEVNNLRSNNISLHTRVINFDILQL